MKIQSNKQISAFGGINFVFEYLKNNNFDSLFDQTLPYPPYIAGQLYAIDHPD
jgi:hypothetical protein